jgi:siroheme synthase-like protein
MSAATGAERPALVGYPANLLLTGRRCLVVGAGRIAARKIEGLLTAGAGVHVVAPELGDAVRALVTAGRITVDQRPFEPSDLDGCWLAVTATGVARVDRTVFEAGEARRVWVNSADDPEHCSFTLMSLVRRGDVVVAIGTGGRSPALAAWLKDRTAAELGPEYETLLELLSEERAALRARGSTSEVPGWRHALDSGMLDLIRAGRTEEAKELLRACLSSSSD